MKISFFLKLMLSLMAFNDEVGITSISLVKQRNFKNLTSSCYMRAIICFISPGFSVVIVITDETLILVITPNVILGIHSHNTFVRKSYARLPVGCDLI